MAELIAIGYDDMETADRAAEEVYRLAQDLVVEPEAVAVIVRDENGRYHVHTNHHPVAEGVTWGMLWGALFGLLFFVPVFGLAVGGVFGALFGLFERIGVDKTFQQEVRDMVKPGTSALFLVVDKVTPDKAIDALGKFGGHILKTSLSKDAEEQIQAALQGRSAPQPATAGTAS
ncbi:MAG TPA: DUF1269 domain-containing protein [Solirubrobacteraceae bacterium]|nr:DUF1269 domain-containing protein [Solirubrobacteraceae bacterium]